MIVTWAGAVAIGVLLFTGYTGYRRGFIKEIVSFFFVLSVLLILRSSLQGGGRKLVPVSGSVMELVLKVLASLVIAPQLGYFGICILEPVIWFV